MSLFELAGITKTYDVDPPIEALRGLDLTVEAGERVAVLGQSGSGKSTLLNIVGLLDEPTSGRYVLDGKDTTAASEQTRNALRAEFLGFVFQESHVLGHRTVEQNILLGLMASGVARSDRREPTERVLERVGLTHRANALGRLLSGGERQRLAVARAVVSQPKVILADEPTGNLDDVNAAGVLELFDAQASTGVAVVVITHDSRTAQWADRVVRLVAGRIEAIPEKLL